MGRGPRAGESGGVGFDGLAGGWAVTVAGSSLLEAIGVSKPYL